MLPFSVLRLTLPSIFETVWYNVIPAVFTYTRKPAATFFENKFCPTSDHVRWGGGDSGVEGGQVIPTSEHQTSCTQADPPLVDCPTRKDLTKAQSPAISASSVASRSIEAVASQTTFPPPFRFSPWFLFHSIYIEHSRKYKLKRI